MNPSALRPAADPDAPVALVTGAARRIGRAIALELAAHGWQVAVHAHRSLDDAERTASDCRDASGRQRDAAVFAADLADAAACDALLPRVAARLRRVDAVVHSASIFEHDDAEGFTPGRLARHVAVNVAPAIQLARALHRHVGERTAAAAAGCVVNLLDQKLLNPNPDHLSYTLSKAALAEATTLLAQALAPRLRVVGVAPGVTLPSGPMDAAAFARAHRLTPLGRSSTPADVARAVRFALESPAITGTTIVVDGGQHLRPQPRDVLFLAAQGERAGAP